jgi:hypothetical protein
MAFNTPPLPRYKRQFRVYDELTSAEVERARAILVDCLGGGDPSVYMQRVVIADDGTYGITVYRPRVDEKRSLAVTPSRENWLAADPEWLPIAAGVALLRSQDNPELIVEARIRKDADEEAQRIHREEAANRQQAEWQGSVAARARYREKECRGGEWDKLSGWVKNDYILAKIFEDAMPEIAAKLRAVADEGRARVTSGSTASARKTWFWPGDPRPRQHEPQMLAAMEASANEGPEPVEGWWRK